MTRWEERATEVEARVAAGDRDHARAVISSELKQAERAGMHRAADRVGLGVCEEKCDHYGCADLKNIIRDIRAEAAK